MMKISRIGEDAFPEPVARIKEKGGNTKNPRLQEHTERPGVVQILGQMMEYDYQCEKTAQRQLKIFSEVLLLKVLRSGRGCLKQQQEKQ